MSGALTLTMQVARLLEDSGTGSRVGKLRQMCVALALDRRLIKDEILTLCVHYAPYGGPVEGLRAASFAWFGNELYRLMRAEAAVLIALPQSPETRRSDCHPDAARETHVRVLTRLGYTSPARVADVPYVMFPFPQDAPHLAVALRRNAPAMLRFDTTVDARLQCQMQALALHAVSGQTAGVSAAIMFADHQT